MDTASVFDLAYEEDILRDPHNLNSWLAYLEAKSDELPEVRNQLFERAVKTLPRSFKLWWKYLNERIEQVKALCTADVAYEKVNNCFERCLVHLHKMPEVWKLYLDFLMKQRKITRSRQSFDRSLRALPITQHLKWIWPLYVEFAKECNVPETAIRIYRRYLKLKPTEKEDFIKYLKKAGHLHEAAEQLALLLNDEQFVSRYGKSKNDLWTEFLNLIVNNPTKVKVNVDAIIRGGIRKFPHQVGKLWCKLAEYYNRLGHFEKSRDAYEEGINTVSTVKDFERIFEEYSEFEFGMLKARMEAAELEAKQNSAEMSDEEEEEEAEEETLDLELRSARTELLIARQPLLLNSVKLRQNPHSVTDWIERIKLHIPQGPEKVILTYTEAVTTVDPQKAMGKPQSLWVNFAKFYEKHDDLDGARTIFEKATLVNYKSVDDLATIWCEWAEMELRHEQYAKAVEVLRNACQVPSKEFRQYRKGGNANVPVQKRLYKSTKLWSMYADLEENFGTLESTKAVYEQMITIKVATPKVILNYASYLEEKKYFEDTYRVYEKGIALFGWPHVYPLWVEYLRKFTGRYMGTKVERTRDLFEQALEKAPAKDARDIWLLYGKYEEQYGLARRAMDVYDRACAAAAPEDRYELYSIYINRCAESFGVTKTREIYEKAVQNLPDRDLSKMCLRFAEMEQTLGEIDRARGVLTYASQFCDPRIDVDFWKTWHDFEVKHGNEDTFREMLRVRRSVQAQFSQINLLTGNLSELAKKPANPIAALEQVSTDHQQQQLTSDKVSEETTEESSTAASSSSSSTATAINPDEINLEDDSTTEPVPQTKAAEKKPELVGAMARFKRKAESD